MAPHVFSPGMTPYTVHYPYETVREPSVAERLVTRARNRMTDQTAYKVLTADEWAALNTGAFHGAPIDIADGFIHLSTEAQLTETVDRHFAGQSGLIIAAIDLVSLGDSVRWELSRHGQLFPHVYAPLMPKVVIAWCPLERHENGTVRLPRPECRSRSLP